MGKKKELNIQEVAKIMHKDAQYVRLGLQQGVFPFRKCSKKTKWKIFL